jgi:hypothetical protein
VTDLSVSCGDLTGGDKADDAQRLSAAEQQPENLDVCATEPLFYKRATVTYRDSVKSEEVGCQSFVLPVSYVSKTKYSAVRVTS